jgi:hypothetical protein
MQMVDYKASFTFSKLQEFKTYYLIFKYIKMKYLFLIISFFFALSSDAQVITSFTGGGTVTNTATVNCDLVCRNFYETAVFQVINTKTSGTVAGKTYFMGSVDGTNYIKLDSITNANQTTNTQVFTQSPPRYPYYRFQSTGVGTMVMTTSGKVHFKK